MYSLTPLLAHQNVNLFSQSYANSNNVNNHTELGYYNKYDRFVIDCLTYDQNSSAYLFSIDILSGLWEIE